MSLETDEETLGRIDYIARLQVITRPASLQLMSSRAH